ncbi:MAG: zinc metallopeptidase [Lachnospiraceae bacterium]|nr:zinc metallopeptidase [Lachnospiraceae bacterium]
MVLTSWLVPVFAIGYGYYGIGRGLYYDPTMLLLIIGGAISLIASMIMRSYADKYSRIKSSSGLTGAQVAQTILQRAGIRNVRIAPISGYLTDHYDPKTKTVNLGEESFNNPSLTGIGVAAHECGHALQDAEGYPLLRLRSTLVPMVNTGTSLSLPLFVMGILFSVRAITTFGIVLFSLAVIFQLVTLPVEINASSRAMKILTESGMLKDDERDGAKKVLTAAALTYVAALLSSLLQLLRLVLIARGNKRRD